MKRREDSSNSDRRDEEKPSPASTDAFGLPCNLSKARSSTSSSDGPLGEGSAARSMGGAAVHSSFGGFATRSLAPPSLTSSQPSGVRFGLEPPSLKGSGGSSSSPFDQPSLLGGRKKIAPSFTVTSSAWKIPEGSIQPVPTGYPLERTSQFVEGSTPSQIASRVSDCLRRRSIAASYGDVKAKAKCKTEDGVEFRVRLYAGKGAYHHGTIVEVQRRSGWSASFQQDCFAILEAAEGGEKDGFDASSSSMDSLLSDARLQGGAGERQSSWVTRSLLENGRTDAKVIGLKGLCAITDVTKVGTGIALENATKIVQDDEEVREILVNLIQNRKTIDSQAQAPGECNLRDLALKAMSNCVEVMAKENVLKNTMKKRPWLGDGLITCLIDEVREAETKPNEAAVAARCLSDLMIASPEAGYKAIELGASLVLSKAKDVGRMLHAKLERETRRGAETLECY